MQYSKNTLSRTLALFLMAAVTLCGTGCDNTAENAEKQNVAMEDLQYGATMKTDTTLPVPVEYDKRFLAEEEAAVLSRYYHSVQEQDTEQFKTALVDFYLDYILETTYNGIFEADAYVKQLNSAFQEAAGGEFTFQLVEVTTCKDETSPTSGIDYLKDMFNTLEGDSYCETHMQSCKSLTVKTEIQTENYSITTDEMTVYVVNLDGTYYVCP